MATKTFMSEEMNQRQQLSITRIREVVSVGIWTDKSLLLRKIEVGYACDSEQARALFEIGLMNGYIEHDQDDNMYRLTDPSSGRRIAFAKK